MASQNSVEPPNPESVATIVYIGTFARPREDWIANSEAGARRRLIWTKSGERRIFLRAVAAQLGLLGVAAVGVTIWILNSDLPKQDSSQLVAEWLMYIFSIWSVTILVGPTLYAFSRVRAASALDDRLRIERIQEDEAELAKEGRAGTEFSELWSLTQRRIDHYHLLATSQSAVAFRTGQTVMGLGFVMLLLLGFAAALAPNGTAAIAASVIAVSGAALSGFVSATFIKSQAEASAQLREFFVQPVDFTRMLGAERLLELLDDPAQKAAAVQTLIASLATTQRSQTPGKPNHTT